MWIAELCHLSHSVTAAWLEGSVRPVEQVEGHVPETEKSESDGKVDQEPRGGDGFKLVYSKH